jgi:hypothetical protein
MKLIVFVAVIAVAFARPTRITQQKQSLLSTKVGRTEAECLEVAKKFVPPAGAVPDSLIEKSQDYCALRYTADDSYVCPHFKDFIANSMADETIKRDKALNAAQLCYLTEYHVSELRVQTMNIPNMAVENATLEEFGVHEDCVPAVTKAMKPETALPTEKVPDFWYQFCLSQDCAHYLPSRHRWCAINKSPTPQHSNQLCLLVRDYAIRNAASFGGDKMNAKDMCKMYIGFIDESLINVEAYEYVVHDGSRESIAVPADPQKALLHSQLINTAGGHYIRDNAASPVKPEAKSSAASYGLGAIFLVLCIIQQ